MYVPFSGEDVVGSFDFSMGNVNCLQYSVTLQQVENIEKGRFKSSKIITSSRYRYRTVTRSKKSLHQVKNTIGVRCNSNVINPT